ncbi:ClpXP protease specificity-enhancing factor [Gilliamella sp. B2776]|uniref:ClpXP protease specificity-enhancing factor n=1 Tax=unclassified Gilliamella TaxID=2685620 RepID=UPI00226A8391|nr:MULTISPECIES: ClpXP protease specificity-enhancing factor [unclassified Gilliamella]MCX8649196.1 ClpXP protease specificity-enhancing factor [Gilliamella sp. B2779]MCX8652928.1 ClpXP protease specificity-enhancing factor [Gilliamella sp. B2737]MCX8655190.1 ClpXP protease specificity-enhancing factor [Gilliamella sp. B2894]MCX8664673.1 ClpXP protease specificity-enhancing factor [Gilliamella sp. B2887]MCX8691008.1 ClpXP protease specificity-enhancing factor [Gilliamella sp. B2776]
MELEQMTPRRPYLFRAFYDWILDNDLTPYIVVNTSIYGVLVPQEFVQNNQIVLNIAPQSVGQYISNNEQIEFNARFSGVPQHIVVPMSAIEAIYARENGVGMGFEDEPQYRMLQDKQNNQSKAPPAKKTNPFRVVK